MVGSPVVELFYKELEPSRTAAGHLEVGGGQAPSQLAPDFFRRWRWFRIAGATLEIRTDQMLWRMGKGRHDNLRNSSLSMRQRGRLCWSFKLVPILEATG
jgi:hypothetical protein